jgi:hypothetical protein
VRPQSWWAFAVGLSIGSLAIALAATFGSAAQEHLPACETVKFISDLNR